MVEERRQRPGLFGPVMLIIVGVILLLSTLGLLQVNWWELWRLWPLLLVLAGLDILSRQSRWASAVVAVLTVVLVGGGFYLLATRPEPLSPLFAMEQDNLVVNPVREELGKAERVEIDIRMGVGELRLDAAEGDSEDLLSGYLNYPERWADAPRVTYNVDGSVGRLRLEGRGKNRWVIPLVGQRGGGESWAVHLSRQVPLSISIDAGASSSLLDLSALQLTDLRVDAGVGRMEVRFPAEGDRMTARIDGGVGELILRVPESVGARVSVDGGLGSKQFGSRFRRVSEGVYETENYASAASRLEVSVDGGVGSVQVW